MSRLKIGNSHAIKIMGTVNFCFIVTGLSLIMLTGCSRRPRDSYARELIAKLDKLYVNLQQYQAGPRGTTAAEAVGSSAGEFSASLQLVNMPALEDIQKTDGYEKWASATSRTLREKADKCLGIIEKIKSEYKENPDGTKDKTSLAADGVPLESRKEAWLQSDKLVFRFSSEYGIIPEVYLRMDFRGQLDAFHYQEELSPLADAVEQGDLSKVESILSAKPELVNIRDCFGDTILHAAALYGHKDIAEILLAKGAEVNAKNSHGETPLNNAAKNSHEDVAAFLIAKGAEVTTKADNGEPEETTQAAKEQSEGGENSQNQQQPQVQKENIMSAKRVRLQTSMGDIVIELNEEKAPVTTANFLKYVEEGFFDGTIFHRVIPRFMVQGGGFEPDMSQKPTHPPIKIESANGLKNSRGTIAMARTNDPDSATSQFFINVVDNRPLDYTPGNPGYAVFGKVVEGLDVADKIVNVKTATKGFHQNVPVEPVVILSAKIIAYEQQ